MSTIRQDAWSHDEDLLLAETVLRHIREGSTQLAAFEEVGQQLSRTSAACGFRWNSLVRKHYDSAIVLAKKQRKAANSKKRDTPKRKADKSNEQEAVHEESVEVETGSITNLDGVIHYLTELKDKTSVDPDLRHKVNELNQQLKVVEEKNTELLKSHEKLKQDYLLMREDYQALMQIMERARRMAGLGGADERFSSGISFQLESKPELEKVKK